MGMCHQLLSGIYLRLYWGVNISITSHLKKSKGSNIDRSTDKIEVKQQEDASNPNNTVNKDIRKSQDEIKDIYTQEVQKNLIFFRRRYYEIGGKST